MLPPGLDTNSTPWSLRSAALPLWSCIVPECLDKLQAPTGACLLFREQRLTGPVVEILVRTSVYFCLLTMRVFRCWTSDEDRAMRLAHSLGLPLGTAASAPPSGCSLRQCTKFVHRTAGLPVSLMPESVCFPKGRQNSAAQCTEMQLRFSEITKSEQEPLQATSPCYTTGIFTRCSQHPCWSSILQTSACQFLSRQSS